MASNVCMCRRGFLSFNEKMKRDVIFCHQLHLDILENLSSAFNFNIRSSLLRIG